MNDWRDPRRSQAALTPTDKRPQDQNTYCFRTDGEIYAVLSPGKWKRIREAGKLNSYLDRQRR